MGSDNLKSIKGEKAKAIKRFRKMQMITSLFRFVEFCMFLVIVCRFSTDLNIAAFKLSGEYFRGLSVTSLISPRFVFLVGNAIFIVLFLQSGNSSDKRGNGNGNGKFDFYEEYMRQSGNNKNQSFYSNYKNEEIKKQGKQSACAKERKIIIQRSQSENSRRLNRGEESPRRELRRSATSVSRRKSEVAPEEMSSEDFRRKVEDFIARQQRALREEEFSVFVSTET